MSVPTVTDRRFRRTRVRPVQRRRLVVFRRRLVRGVALATILALALFRLPDLVRSAHWLHIETIAVEGLAWLSEGEVLTLVGGLRGRNIFAADLDAHRDLLLGSGWIEAATLRRVLPATVEVEIVERRPAALARSHDVLYLVAVDLGVIDEYGPRFGHVDLPLVDGLWTEGRGTGDPRRERLAAAVLSALGGAPDLERRVSQIGVGDPHDAVVLLHDGPTVVHLGEEAFVSRLRQYVELAPTLRDHVEEIDYVDMRFDGRVVVRAAEDDMATTPLLASRRGSGARLR